MTKDSSGFKDSPSNSLFRSPITAPVYHFCSSLPAACTQPGAFTLADLCTSRGQVLREFTQHSFLIEISYHIWFGRRTLPCGRHWWTFPKRKRVLVVASTDSAANVDVVKQKTSCCSSHSRVQFLLPQRTINGNSKMSRTPYYSNAEFEGSKIGIDWYTRSLVYKGWLIRDED